MREIFLAFLISAGVYTVGYAFKGVMDARLQTHEEYVMRGD